MDEKKVSSAMDTGDLQEVAGGYRYDPFAASSNRGPVPGQRVCPRCKKNAWTLGIANSEWDEHIKNCGK